MELLSKIKEALDKVKAYDVVIYDLKGISPLADYVVIASVDVVRQANAVIANLEELTKDDNVKIRGIEGRDSSWILLDFYDVILHVFTKEERQNYDLDKLYVGIKKLDVNKL